MRRIPLLGSGSGGQWSVRSHGAEIPVCESGAASLTSATWDRRSLVCNWANGALTSAAVERVLIHISALKAASAVLIVLLLPQRVSVLERERERCTLAMYPSISLFVCVRVSSIISWHSQTRRMSLSRTPRLQQHRPLGSIVTVPHGAITIAKGCNGTDGFLCLHVSGTHTYLSS